MDFKNDFLTNSVGKRLDSLIGNENGGSMFFWTETGRLGGPCYYALDQVYPTSDHAYVWTPPCLTKNVYNQDNNLIDFYNEIVYFDPTSPWAPIILAMEEEMFEGYRTLNEKVELVNKIGFVVGPKLFKQFSKVALCSFFVFWRRAFEFNGVRQSLENFLESPYTKNYPLLWNVFAAHHIFSKPGGKLTEVRWENWHNNFDTRKYPSTPISFITKFVCPVDDWKHSWANNSKTSFMSGNSDRLFPNLLTDKEKEGLPKKFDDPPTEDHSGYESKKLITSAIEYNQKVYEDNVRSFI